MKVRVDMPLLPGLASAGRQDRWAAKNLKLLYGSFFFQAEDGIRDYKVTGVQPCALPIYFKVKYSEKVNANIFASAASCGCDEIIISTLRLNKEMSLPITIPHGVDFHHLMTDLDIHCHEPIYMAFRDDIAERVAKFKAVLKFPHPWLLIISEQKIQKGQGTLFVAPPPSLRNFEAMKSKI